MILYSLHNTEFLFKVLHHLDKDKVNGKSPMLEKTLLETRRVLRPDGVLLVSTCLPMIIQEAFWFTQIHQGYRDKLASLTPDAKEYLAIFDRSGFQCVAAMNLLATDSPNFIQNYSDCEGPLKADWRNGTCMFECVGDKLLNEMETSLLEMKAKGTLNTFMKDNDRTADKGMLTVFACVSKY